jgi:hypothetical protein
VISGRRAIAASRLEVAGGVEGIGSRRPADCFYDVM